MEKIKQGDECCHRILTVVLLDSLLNFSGIQWSLAIHLTLHILPGPVPIQFLGEPPPKDWKEWSGQRVLRGSSVLLLVTRPGPELFFKDNLGE